MVTMNCVPKESQCKYWIDSEIGTCAPSIQPILNEGIIDNNIELEKYISRLSDYSLPIFLKDIDIFTEKVSILSESFEGEIERKNIFIHSIIQEQIMTLFQDLVLSNYILASLEIVDNESIFFNIKYKDDINIHVDVYLEDEELFGNEIYYVVYKGDNFLKNGETNLFNLKKVIVEYT